MKKARTVLIFAILILMLLFTGWMLFKLRNVASVQVEAQDFRFWFWNTRSLDLIVQVLLVFAGSLAIAAILPLEENDG